MQLIEAESPCARTAPLRHRVLSALSWRLDARNARRPVKERHRAQERFGRLLYWAGAHRRLPNVTNRAAVLCFHGLGTGRLDEVAGSVLHVRAFRQILRVLKQSFHVLPLAELVDILQERRSPPAKSVVITFDDGYASNLEIAAPELDKLRMPWSAFLPAMLIETRRRQWTDDIRMLVHRGSRRELAFHLNGKQVRLDLSTAQARVHAVESIHQQCRYVPESLREPALNEIYAQYSNDEIESLRQQYSVFAPMTWDHARELKAAGVELGNHSLNHIALAVQTPERMRHEVLAAEALLRERIGEISPHFSYPYGSRASFSDETAVVLREVGYRCALTLVHEVVRCPLEDLMCLPRLIVASRPGRTLNTLWQLFK